MYKTVGINPIETVQMRLKHSEWSMKGHVANDISKMSIRNVDFETIFMFREVLN